MTINEYLEGRDKEFIQDFVNRLIDEVKNTRTEAENRFAGAAEKFVSYKDTIERTEESIKNGAGYGDEWLVELKAVCSELDQAKTRLVAARNLDTLITGYALALNEIDYTYNLEITRNFFSTYEPTDGGNSDLDGLVHLGMLSLQVCVENAESSITESKQGNNHSTSWVGLLSNCVNALVGEMDKDNMYRAIVNKVMYS